MIDDGWLFVIVLSRDCRIIHSMEDNFLICKAAIAIVRVPQRKPSGDCEIITERIRRRKTPVFSD